MCRSAVCVRPVPDLCQTSRAIWEKVILRCCLPEPSCGNCTWELYGKKSGAEKKQMAESDARDERAAVTGREIGAKAERSASSGYTGSASQTGVRKGAKAGQSTDELRGQTYRATSTLRNAEDS